jgi:hypothetical protein
LGIGNLSGNIFGRNRWDLGWRERWEERLYRFDREDCGDIGGFWIGTLL